MRIFELQRTLEVPRPRDEVFEFFADAANLDTLTPPWLRFRILTPSPIAMHLGTVIRYRLRIRGVPIGWLTEITAWEPPIRFVDKQQRGPYRLWEHEHTFEEVGTGSDTRTIVSDRVRYSVRGGTVVGSLLHRLFVRRDLEKIFEYRHQRLSDVFAGRGRGRRSA